MLLDVGCVKCGCVKLFQVWLSFVVTWALFFALCPGEDKDRTGAISFIILIFIISIMIIDIVSKATIIVTISSITPNS